MRLIIAYIPTEHLKAVLKALMGLRIHGLSMSHVQGFGQEPEEALPDYHLFEGIELTKKVRLEIGCHAEECEGILAAIYQAAHSGQRGNGKVFVIGMEDALRLKTGERGAAALGPVNPKAA